MRPAYTQHSGRVINTDSTFKHVMAIALDPRSYYKEGVIRCITSREGDVSVSGYTDRSELHHVTGNSLESFTIGEKLNIAGEDDIIKGLLDDGHDFIGLEDPDIWIDEKTDLMHLYFTLPLIGKKGQPENHNNSRTKIHLGHAVGKNLHSLMMTVPVITHDHTGGAKELSIAPVNSKGIRLNLVESSDTRGGVAYSTVRTALAYDMGAVWDFGDVAFHPANHNIPWIGEHASPGPLLPESFLNIGPNKRVGIMNGRERSTMKNGVNHYNIFSVGLFIYDYEEGMIEWISHHPLIRDTEARTITFASQFIETGKGEGILYAHVDDSFVRAYTLFADGTRDLLPH